MASVDDRIVRMEFDNGAFEKKLATTLASLGKLDKALEFKSAATGISGLQAAAGKIDLSGIASSLENISSKFHALGAVGFTVISELTKSFLGFAKQIGGDILGPIITGGTARAKNIEQAKFMFEGLGLDVQAGMDSALAAVKGTAFGLDEAAKAAAQFGASGIKVGAQMTGALRGVAGAAAMTGSSFTEMADIFAGSAGTGKVTNQDLMQFATRGLNAASAVGKVLGKTEAQVHEMATKGTLDFQTFADAMDKAFGAHATEANKTFTGALANLHAAMSRLGAAFIAPELTQFRDIFNALSPVIDNVTAALKPLMETINNISRMMANSLIEGLGGLDFSNLIKAIPFVQQGFLNIFMALGKIFDIGRQAFRDIFPKSTTSLIVTIAQAFQKFTEYLIIGGQTAEKLRRIFDGFFSVFSIGWEIIKQTAIFIGQLAAALGGLSGGKFLDFAVKLGDFFTHLNDILVKGGGIEEFFNNLTDAIKGPIPFLDKLQAFFGNLFGGFDQGVADAVDGSLGRISDRFQNLSTIIGSAGKIWDPFEKALNKYIEILDTVWSGIRDWFQQLGQKIADTMGEGDFNSVLDAINVGLLGGIAALLARFIKTGFRFDLGGGLFDKISQTFEQLTGVLKSMQLQIKAEALIKIAIAIGILTASVLVLSMIDSAALTKALTAMAVGFGQLMAAFAVLTNLDSGISSGASFTLIAGGLILLATAILVLSVAVKNLADLNWAELARGMTALTGMLILLSVFAPILAANSSGMISAGAGIAAMSIGLLILGAAMKVFATLNWAEIGKGLVTVAGLLVIIGLAMNLMPNNLLITGAGLIFVGIALNILAGAMKLFAMMDWGEIGKGLVAIAGALVVIGLATNLMPISLPITAAGLILVGIALGIIAKAMQSFGSMSWAEIARGLVGMAGALVILAAAAYAMQGTVLGAVAIGILAVSLGVLFTVIESFAGLSWGDLLHGLLGFAAALAALALLSFAISPFIGNILALGIALTSVGIGFALFGVGVMLLAKGLEGIAKSGKGAAEAIPAILTAIGKAIPAFSKGLAQGMVDLIMVFADAAPVLAKALGALLDHLIDTVIKLIPKFAKALDQMVTVTIKFLDDKAPLFIDSGLKLLNHLLEGILANIDHITDVVSEIIVKFLESLTDHAEDIVTAGMTLLETFLNGIADNIDKVIGAVGNIVTSFIAALAGYYIDLATAGVNALIAFIGGITSNVVKIVEAVTTLITTFITAVGNAAIDIATAATNMIITFAQSMADNAWRIIATVASLIIQFIGEVGRSAEAIATAGADAIIDFVEGLGRNAQKVVDAGAAAILKFIEGLATTTEDFVTACADILIDFLNQMATTIREKDPELKAAGGNIMDAILNGMTFGLSDKVKSVGKTFADKLGGVVTSAKSALKVVGDPYSLVFMGIGEAMMNGMTMALDADTSVEKASVGVVTRTAAIFENSLSMITDSLGNIEEFNPTITPVLDLTQVAADASRISDYMNTAPLNSAYSYKQASVIASDTNVIEDPLKTSAVHGEVNFEQNIYAPEQLSTSDIYKQTRNQLTLAKEELSIP